MTNSTFWNAFWSLDDSGEFKLAVFGEPPELIDATQEATGKSDWPLPGGL